MYLGRVIGTVVSTSKNEDLIGMKLLIVERLDEHLQRSGETEIAVDSVGAGNGEIVIVCGGSANDLPKQTAELAQCGPLCVRRQRPGG